MKTFKIVNSTDRRHVGEYVSFIYPLEDPPIELLGGMSFSNTNVLRQTPLIIRLVGSNYTMTLKET